MRKTSCHLITFAILVVLCPNQQAHGIVIDTLTDWNGTDFWYPFGEGRTRVDTLGQTITVGTENYLTSFGFPLRLIFTNPPPPVHFRAYVMEWDSVSIHAVGPVLYSSEPMTVTNADVYQTYTANTGALPLITGKQYVLFFSCSNDLDGILDAASWAQRSSGNPYPGGSLVFLNNGSAFGDVTTQAWTRYTPYDLAFRAELISVPEPSAITLAVVMLGLVGCRRQHRSSRMLPHRQCRG